MAPDLERLARTPWPIACCASSGTRLFNSDLARSCSTKAGWVSANAVGATSFHGVMSSLPIHRCCKQPQRLEV